MMKILPHPTGKSKKQWLTITSIYSGQELCKFTYLIFINILQLHCKVDTVNYPYGHTPGNWWSQNANTKSLIPEPKILPIMMVKNQLYFFLLNK